MKNESMRCVAGIYGLRCKTSGKWYVGQSTNIYKRWEQYESHRCKEQSRLYNALIKYGYDDFEKVVLEECSNDPVVLTIREKHWMEFYNTLSNGYNMREAGSRGKMSIESRQRMSESARNKPPVSEETRKKLSMAALGRKCEEETRRKIGEKNSGRKYGPMSEEHKQKISVANLGRKQPKISAQQVGKKRKPFSEEHKKKIAESNRKWWEQKRLFTI